MLYLDTESIGLHGATTLIQWAEDDGPITTWHVWEHSPAENVAMLEELTRHVWCAFNLVHDAFHLQRLHNVCSLMEAMTPEEWIRVQRGAVHGPCLKPQGALDLYLHARKGPMQTLMERDDVRIKRVPAHLAPSLAHELQERIDLDPIFFERSRAGYQWTVSDYFDDDMPDVVLRFRPSVGLKPLAAHLLGADTLDLPIPKERLPESPGWNPYDESWVPHLDWHREHWHKPQAVAYAEQDVDLLRRLREYWQVAPDDDDSELAVQLGCSRWRGYAVDIDRLRDVYFQATDEARDVPERNSSKMVVERINELINRLDDTERNARGIRPVKRSRTVEELEPLSKKAHGTLLGEYVDRVMHARRKDKEADQARKLVKAGRFHPSFKVIGALSGRMAGAGGLNPQGIASAKKGSKIRSAFTMADPGFTLDGGDFASFQVVLAAAVWDDPDLTRDLASGKKFHGVYGASMYDMDYDDLIANPAKYGKSKNAVFATLFGAQTKKLSETLALPEEKAEEGLERLRSQYPGIGRAEEATAEKFTPMKQLEGGQVIWEDPADYVESIFGYRRYFTLENQIVRALFELAEDPPPSLRSKEKVLRREHKGEQTAGGAVRSALYAAAFGMQARNARCAKNHEIQSPEATIAKSLQRQLWDMQPSGVYPWLISLLPVHDELVCVHDGGDLAPTVQEIIDTFKDKVPLIAMDWRTGLENWGRLK